jgi:hypothetical protein
MLKDVTVSKEMFEKTREIRKKISVKQKERLLRCLKIALMIPRSKYSVSIPFRSNKMLVEDFKELLDYFADRGYTVSIRYSNDKLQPDTLTLNWNEWEKKKKMEELKSDLSKMKL